MHPNLRIIAQGLVFLACVSHAWAKPKSKAHPHASAPIAPVVDATVLKLSRATKNPKLASGLLDHPLWGDYATFIEVHDAFRHKRYPQVIALSQSALVRYPMSPLRKNLTRFLGMAELETASRMDQFEKALTRLDSIQNLYLIQRPALERFAKFKDIPWLKSLQAVFPFNSKERKLIDSVIAANPQPEIKTLPYVSTTQSYRATIEPDVELYESLDKDDSLTEFLKKFPKSVLRPRALYWSEQVKTLWDEHPLHSFSMFAAIEEQKLPKFETRTFDSIKRDPSLGPYELKALDRAEKLIQGKLLDFAAIELLDFKVKGSSEFLVYLMSLQNTVGNYRAALSVLGELAKRNHPIEKSADALRTFLPTPYLDVIKKESQSEQIPYALVLALTKQESGFQETAGSQAGALGLMQLIPSTATEIEPELAKQELTLGAVNIRIGVKYLKRLLSRFDGNLIHTLGAYNAGPGNMRKWLREKKLEVKSGPKSELLMIEKIPFKETREYVSSVMAGYAWYTWLETGKLPLSLKDLSTVSVSREPPEEGLTDTERTSEDDI